MRRHRITNEEKMLSWMQVERKCKLTSFTTICRHFWFMSKTKDVLHSLISTGHVKKLKGGYRAYKTASIEKKK
jgi:hypothetical protein